MKGRKRAAQGEGGGVGGGGGGGGRGGGSGSDRRMSRAENMGGKGRRASRLIRPSISLHGAAANGLMQALNGANGANGAGDRRGSVMRRNSQV